MNMNNPSIHVEKTIRVFVTPLGLREIADLLERQMPNATIGENVPSVTWYKGQELSIKLLADQAAYHAHKTGNKSRWV